MSRGAAPEKRPNSRNGTTLKTIVSEVCGFTVDVPRDRAGTFMPRLIRGLLSVCLSPRLSRSEDRY
ncbi:transposase [Bowdeniella nasicola]|uniref:transposase n=1 Tax=Bowdeniella nasicola TaxID=208480 RepID=UPI001C9EA06C